MGDEARWTVSPDRPRGRGTHRPPMCMGTVDLAAQSPLLPVLGWSVVRGMSVGRGSLSHSPSGPSPADPMRRTPESTLCLGRRPASHDALAASPVTFPSLAGRRFRVPRPPTQQFHFPVRVGGAQRAEHPCPRSARIRAGAAGALASEPKAPDGTAASSRGWPDCPPLPQAQAAAAALDGHSQVRTSCRRAAAGEGWLGPPNQALGPGTPPCSRVSM